MTLLKMKAQIFAPRVAYGRYLGYRTTRGLNHEFHYTTSNQLLGSIPTHRLDHRLRQPAGYAANSIDGNYANPNGEG